MGYVAGEKILDDEFNTFLNGSTAAQYGINHIMGTGAGGYGLGQTELGAVTNGDTITVGQWNGLFTAMDNIANHTNRTLTTGTTTQRVAGDPIAIKAALSGDLNDLAADVVGGCTSATAVSEGSELQSSAASARWNESHIVEQSITFSNNNAGPF